MVVTVLKHLALVLTLTFAGLSFASESAKAQQSCPRPVPSDASAAQLIACIASLQTELADIKRSKEVMSNAIPKGAVVAYEGFSGCPEGWSTYTPATSRVIVGAGDLYHPKHREWFMQLPTGGEKRLTLEPFEPMSSGGEQQHMLTAAELPRHDHFVMARGQGEITPGDIPTEVVAQWGKHHSDANYHYSFRMFKDRVADWGRSSAFGGDPKHPESTVKPHNNMPPFLALHYCVKD